MRRVILVPVDIPSLCVKCSIEEDRREFCAMCRSLGPALRCLTWYECVWCGADLDKDDEIPEN